MGIRGGRRRTVAACAAVLGVVLLAGCTDTPPPPLAPPPPKPGNNAQSADLKQIVVGVDRIGRGFNPHKIADASTMTTALAEAMLPSVFRPAADGTPELDRTVMESAKVTSANPFTVTYTVRQDASWSDGVPVRAEDFLYLRDQMANQPGVVAPAGYRLISDITSADGGRVVQVRFAKPYPGWRSLFSDLLPGHLLKDAPGGWDAALADSFPASAGPFTISNLDRDRGEVTLVRNERYWSTPAVADTVILRRSDVAGVAAGLRSGDSQLATVSSDSATAKAIGALGPAVHTALLPRDAIAQVNLRPSGQLADVRVRKAIADAMDRAALINAGGGDGSRPADALVYAPSQRGYSPTMPSDAPGAQPRPHAVNAQLLAAGYHRSHGTWLADSDGSPLRITVAAAAGAEPYQSIATALVKQLTDAGLPATLVTPQAGQLYGTMLQQDQVNVLVAPRVVGADPTTQLAGAYGCPPTPPGANSPQPAGPGDVCDPELQPTIDALITGQRLLSDELPGLEHDLWEQAYTVPLFQVTDLLAVRGDIRNVPAGPSDVAPFDTAGAWTRVRG